MAEEDTWVTPRTNDPETAFLEGTIGTELAPLPVLMALPVLVPEHFHPGGPAAGDWIDQFGFARPPEEIDGCGGQPALRLHPVELPAPVRGAVARAVRRRRLRHLPRQRPAHP